MLVIQLVGSVAALVLHQLTQTPYEMVAVLGLILIGIGVEARSSGCAGAGTILLMLALTVRQA
ncbi:hypothetical protein ABZ848_40460 [Streptomyces sp. NPDC047081]|uniref:hypothetical protein n=1 Tax=Streptomyces sp. NPDC047081 TaxID=3154706 RepID=UPI003401C69C